uniref:Cytochrome b5 heme-binding domain-containing protein n=1 Tax=Trypanosoma congolense (strain IL3000) TaxID=1068625 RepID=G0UKY7_TRYCI|nr:conserved hypothetical protein [Trypanosoma congolense IL3000]
MLSLQLLTEQSFVSSFIIITLLEPRVGDIGCTHPFIVIMGHNGKQLLKIGTGILATAALAMVARGVLRRLGRLPTGSICSRGGKKEIRPVESIVKRGFTASELSKHNGEDGSDVYISVKGVVFEVAPQLYGPGQSYHVYAGREIGRCLAKNDTDGTEINKHWLPHSTEEELERLEVWMKKFESKYPVVGWFVWE